MDHSDARVHARYTEGAPLAPAGELLRAQGQDSVTGAPVEIVRPAPHAALRDGARARFARAWTPRPPAHPAWLPALAGPAPDGKPVGVRPAIGAPWQPDQRLAADEVRQLAGWLGGGLLAGGLEGGLAHEDLVLDADGVPRISPAGLVRVESIAALPYHVPPRRDSGPAGDRDAALYGLGVVLFRALTGAWPAEGRSPAALHAAQARPRRARELRPEVPADVDALLAALLDPDPSRRAPAVAAVAHDRPPVLALPAAAPAPAPAAAPAAATAAPALRVTQAAPARSAARVDDALPPWLVVLDRAAATEASLRRLEALLPDLPHFALRDGMRDESAVIVGTAPTEAAARSLAESLGRAGAPLTVQSAAAPAPAVWGQVLGWVGAAVLAPVLGFLLAGPVAAGLGIALSLVLALVGGVAVRRSKEQARALARPESARLPALPSAQSAVLDAIRTARQTILGAELAAPLRVDLLDALDGIETAALATTDARPDELADLRAAAAEVGAAATAAVDGGARPEASRAAVDAARRRAAAARAALRQG